MPIIKSALKKMRVDQRRTLTNLGRKTELKTIIAKAIETKDKDIIRLAISKIDKAAKTNLIHKNKAGRKKSLLMSLNNVTETKAEVAPKKTKRAKKTTK